MKKSNYLLNLLLAILLIGGVTACKEDPVIEEEEGLPVADGIYITQSDVDPVATHKLVPETVVDDGFASQDRAGYVAAYLFLTAGDYNMVQVTDKAITEIYGGSKTVDTITDASDCGYDDTDVIGLTMDGAAFSVASDGLYKVTYDAERSETLLHKIEKAGLIGTATDFGWGGDTDLPLSGSITADGATWEGTEINMKEGAYKLRFNCRWDINRLIVADGGVGFDNGYFAYLNFSGTKDNLTTGNDSPDIELPLADQAQYTITVSWTPLEGWTMTHTRTGDYVPPAFDPADHPWSVRGTAGSDWDTGLEMAYKGVDGTTHTWAGVFELSSGDGTNEFKVADGGTWLGVGLVTDNTAGLLEGTDNFIVGDGNDGFYYFVVQTSDEGVTYTASVDKASFGIIGDATPTGWDSDTDMTESGSSWTLDIALTATGGWKFRANDDWTYNLGGALDGLTVNGDNLTVGSDATYSVTLTTADKGLTYTATVN